MPKSSGLALAYDTKLLKWLQNCGAKWPSNRCSEAVCNRRDLFALLVVMRLVVDVALRPV